MTQTMMTTAEMKEILVDKFQAENCGFKKSDISIRKMKKGYFISIKDYDHITFSVNFEKDDYFGYIVWIFEKMFGEATCVSMCDSKYGYRLDEALVQLGYHIANTF